MASASKLISALVLMRLMEEGSLSLDDTPGGLLGWSGGAADATLDQLGAFVSGLDPNAACTYLPWSNLPDCVDTIRDADVLAAPGARFDYGATHLHVAGRMAEVATGESWEALFERTLKTPLGLDDPGLVYVTLPQQALGSANPLIAGGLLASVDEYLPMLALLFHDGQLDGSSWIAADRMARFQHNPHAAAVLGHRPGPAGVDSATASARGSPAKGLCRPAPSSPHRVPTGSRRGPTSTTATTRCWPWTARSGRRRTPRCCSSATSPR